MTLLKISSRFYPIRLNAFMRSEAELSIEVENTTDLTLWFECDVLLPDAISLAPDRSLGKGRLRVGIIDPRGKGTGKCKIYAGVKSYPDRYPIQLIAYAYGRDGAIIGREESKTELRCEQVGSY